MILSFQGKTPDTKKAAFVAGNSSIIGSVTLSEKSSVWFSAVLRGDECPITVGEGSNIQDNASVHGDFGHDVVIGKNVTVGHNAVVHGCEVGDGTLIGMGAIVLNGAKIGRECVIGAGAVVKENEIVPDRSLVVGVPAKVIRAITDPSGNLKNAETYIALAEEYAAAH